MAQSVIQPAIENIVSKGKYTEAQALLLEASNMVVDGKKGTLGGTSDAGSVLSRLCV